MYRSITVESEDYKNDDDEMKDYPAIFSQWAFKENTDPISYPRSKLLQVLHTIYAQEAAEENGLDIHSFAIIPGLVKTGIFAKSVINWNPILRMLVDFVVMFVSRTPKQAAQTILHCAYSTIDSRFTGGGCFRDCQSFPIALTKQEVTIAQWKQMARQMNELSEEIYGEIRDRFKSSSST